VDVFKGACPIGKLGNGTVVTYLKIRGKRRYATKRAIQWTINDPLTEESDDEDDDFSASVSDLDGSETI
jgi:hypothetical protein